MNNFDEIIYGAFLLVAQEIVPHIQVFGNVNIAFQHGQLYQNPRYSPRYLERSLIAIYNGIDSGMEIHFTEYSAKIYSIIGQSHEHDDRRLKLCMAVAYDNPHFIKEVHKGIIQVFSEMNHD